MSSAPRRAALPGCAILLLAALACKGTDPAPGPDPSPSSGPKGLRLLLVGVDGADWKILRPLMEDGSCPAIARLAAASALGSLDSPPPRISPILWTGMMTGRQPEEHGVLDFLEPGPDGAPQPISSRARKADAVWNILSRHGVRTGVVGFWATWPAEPISGIMVSDAFAPSLVPVAHQEALVSPPEWQERLAPRRGDDAAVEALMGEFVKGAIPPPEVPLASEGAYVPRDPVVHLRAILAGTLAYHRASLEILEHGDVDVLLVYHELVDEVCHRFIRDAPPPMPGVPDEERERFGGAVRAAYVLEDRLLGELIERTGPETAVVLVSDHGFLSGAERPLGDPADFEGQASAWHRAEAVLMVRAPSVAPGTPLGGSVLDTAATLLGLAGIRGELPGKPLAGIGAPISPRAPSEGGGAPMGSASSEGAPSADASAAKARLAELEALGYLSRGSSAQELTANAQVNLGNSLTFRGRHPEARAAYAKALAIDPDHPRALYDMAASLQEGGDEAGALPYLERLARLDGRIPPGSLLRLAVIAAKHPDGLASARELVEARPEPSRGSEWHGAMGLLLAAAGARDEARRMLTRSVEMGSDMAPPILGLLALTPEGAERTRARELCARAISAMQSKLALESLRAGLAAQGEPELARLAHARLQGAR